MAHKNETILVIGGGFLGRWICDKLLDNQYAVKVFDIRKPFDDDRISEFCLGDLRKAEDLAPALKGCIGVIHTASPPYDAPKQVLLDINVEGTRNLLAQAKIAGVKRFVFTSSGSVVCDGKDIIHGDESMPYAKNGLDGYARSKAMAEDLVLKANDEKSGFVTCALRVSGLFGPRDAHFIPQIVSVAQSGKSKFSMTNAVFDWTYIENAADAHVLALQKLRSNTSQVGGQAFFITNDEPFEVFKFFSLFWRGFGLPTPRFNLPITVILYVALIFDYVRAILAPIVKIETTFTYFRMWSLAYSRIYSIKKANRILEYKPTVDLMTGVNRTIAWFKQNRSDILSPPPAGTSVKKQH